MFEKLEKAITVMSELLNNMRAHKQQNSSFYYNCDVPLLSVTMNGLFLVKYGTWIEIR